MNRAILYLIVIGFYLTLSNTLNPSQSGIEYIKRSRDLRKIVNRTPASVILLQTLTKGHIIKTYYQRYKVVYGHQYIQEVLVRTRKRFVTYSKDFIGMSLLRIDSNGVYNTTPMPPGALFVGDKQFGNWRKTNGVYRWSFYKSYRNLPVYLGWGDFRPDKEFYNYTQQSKKLGIPFFGLNSEFGTNGSITAEFVISRYSNKKYSDLTVQSLLNDYTKTNYTY